MSLQDWQQRVINEQNDLFEKIGRLELFIDQGDDFSKLDDVEQELLRAQKGAMFAYAKILEVRILLFDAE